MASDPFEAISVKHRAIAREALSAVVAFGKVAAITPIGGGASGASTFRVAAAGRRFFLRLEGPASPLRNPHQYASARIASEAGIAPRIYWADEVAGVAVTQYVDAQPLEAYPGGPLALARALGELLRRVQATPPFAEFVRYPDIAAFLSGTASPGLDGAV